MKRLVHFAELADSRLLFQAIRNIPDDWNAMAGRLSKPQTGQSVGLVKENVLRIDSYGVHLHSQDGRYPDLMGIFAGSRRVDTVIIENAGYGFVEQPFKLCRSLASGLVERGYTGNLLFEKRAHPAGIEGPTMMQVRMSLVPPTGLSSIEINWNLEHCPKDAEKILRNICGYLEPDPDSAA